MSSTEAEAGQGEARGQETLVPLGEGQRLAAGILGVSVSSPRNIFLSHKTSLPKVT